MSFLQETGIRVLNHVRHRMELGRDTYATGKISTELTDELCAVLLDFKQMMKEFGVEDYRAWCDQRNQRDKEYTGVP